MDKIKYRRALFSERDDLLALNQQGFEYDLPSDSTLNMNWTSTKEAQDYFDDRISSDDKVAIVAEVDQTLIGFIVGAVLKHDLCRTTKKMAEVDIMFVAESYRHQSVGGSLMDEFIKWAKKQDCERITVTAYATNSVAVSFYQKKEFNDYALILERKINA